MKRKTLFTIGYEDVTVDGLVRALRDAGVKTLIDVRAIPQSRKPGLSKNRLAARLAEDGIEYLSLKGLGTPAAGRDAARKGRTAEMHKIFLRHLKTREAQDDLQTAIDTATSRRACLLCLEHDAQICHRLLVADAMAEKTGMKVVHIDPLAPVR